jgi:hypothetical protein
MSNKNLSATNRCMGSPVASVGPTADFYLERAEH